MKTTIYRFNSCVFYYSQSLAHQGCSHYFSITPTTYTLHQPLTFVQHSTQPYNRYTYALNNPLRYKDPSGEAFIADDILAAVIGGVLNVVVNRHYISKQIAEITYTHEYSHLLDNTPNIAVPNEAKAFLMESKIYNALTQYRIDILIPGRYMCHISLIKL